MIASPPALLTAFLETPVGAMIVRQNLLLLTPELLLLLTALILLLLTVSRQDVLRREIWPTAAIGTFAAWLSMSALFALTHLAPHGALLVDPVNMPVLNDQLRVDLMGSIVRWTMFLSLFLVVLMSRRYLERRLAASAGECCMLLACATVGASLLAMANDLTTFFVALETLGISSFLLAGFLRAEARSLEAALKFLLYGGAASACLLFGFSLLYGLSGGHTDFPGIIAAFSGGKLSTLAPLVVAPAMVALILAGLLFKLSAAPFHQWTPDVYEGAPTPATAYLSVVSKLGAFAAAIRVLALILAPLLPPLQANAGHTGPLFGALALAAIVSMTLGNVVALRQTSLKRLLAYSTIAHIGYLLLALALAAVGVRAALPAALFYLVAYAFMNLGAFAAAIRFETESGGDAIADMAGLARKKPWLAGALSLFLLSLAGIPITSGFFAKFFLFQALATTGGPAFWLILYALLNSAISLYYYLNVIRRMVVDEPSSVVARLSRGMRQPASSAAMAAALGVCATATLALGVWAEPVMGVARHAIGQLGKADPYARVFMLSQRP